MKKSGPKHLRHGSRTDRLLRELVDELDLLFTVGHRPTAVMRYGMEGIRRTREARARKERRDAMRILRRKKMVKIERIGQAYRVALTKVGAEAYWRSKMLAAEELPEGQAGTCVHCT